LYLNICSYLLCSLFIVKNIFIRLVCYIKHSYKIVINSYKDNYSYKESNSNYEKDIKYLLDFKDDIGHSR